jgi:predicted RNase H-like HicB family nuclease
MVAIPLPSLAWFVTTGENVQTTPREVKTFTAYVEWDPESQLYVGIVPGISGAHTQAATLDELRQNLKEVLELCFEEEVVEAPRFVGIQQIDIEV